MKIAIVNDHFSSGPGGQHRLQNIAGGFSRLGHQVIYVTPNGISNRIVDSSCPALTGTKRFFYAYFNEFSRVYKNLKVLPSDVDCLIIGLPNTMSKSLNAFFGVSKKIPTSFDFGGLWTSFFDKGRTYGYQSMQLKFIRPISQLYEDSLTLFSSRLPNIITVPTSGMDRLFEKFCRRDAHVIYQPVDTSRALNPTLVKRTIALASIPKKFEQSKIVAIGVKGDEWFVPIIEDLVQKFKRSDLVFLVIGSFPKAEYACKKRGLSDKIFFTGNVPYSILPSYIALTQFSVVLTHPDLASIWYAPHNIAKIADYMAMGKPVVTDSLSAIDYVNNGVNGFLVRNKENLIRRTGTLLDDQAFLQKISEAARKTALENFDSVKVAKSYLELFSKSH
jgi:glycosyltransferase involved in cell wall biosynthesis